jgi:hypothetical protein
MLGSECMYMARNWLVLAAWALELTIVIIVHSTKL